MKVPLAAFCFLCSCFLPFFSTVLSPATGRPLQSDSPGRVFALPGEDVILPCHSTTSVHPSHVTAVEWLRVDGPSLLTVHVERDGEELVKEKAAEYLGRTATMHDGSLKLLGVTQQDSGTYRCVLLRGAVTEDGVLVSLIVGEVPEVNVILRRTSANEMFVDWESSGWILKPRISLLDAKRTELHANTKSSFGPGNLYSVSAQVNAATAKETGTIICRVEIPGTSMGKEKQIFITDEFISPEAGLVSYVVSIVILVVAIALLIVLALMVFFVVPMDMIENLRSRLQHWIEYGDINQVSTTGYSRQLSINGEVLTGVEASKELARRDLERMKLYKDKIITVGNKLSIHPALIAGIISRQSQFGASLKVDGYGNSDSSSFGLMQINKYYHAVKGNAYSEEHLDEGVTFFIQLIKTMERKRPNWTKEQRLKGALACYVSGEEKVLPLAYEELDTVTPNGDFANDVVARAQWFAKNAF